MATGELNATYNQLTGPLPALGALETSVLGAGDTASPPCIAPPAVPDRIGPFRIEGRLGEGAEGILYRAIDERLGRAVAIKVMRSNFQASQSARQRFVSEARLAASVESDHVIRILEVGEQENALPYLVMELIEGIPLSDLPAKQGPLPPRQAAELVRQAAEGLAAVHERRLQHRDVKSANLLLDAKSGRVKLADFGLAKVLQDELPLTADNFLTGTPAFMSPEQITSPLAVDARSDVYSLGVVLYELLTGQLPFQGSVRMVLTRILHEPPVRPSAHHDLVPASLEAICLRALAKAPGERFVSAKEFATTLQQFLQGELEQSPAAPRLAAAPVQPSLGGSALMRWAPWILLGAFGMVGGGVLLIVGSIVLIAALGAAAGRQEEPRNATQQSPLQELDPATEPTSHTDGDAAIAALGAEEMAAPTEASPKLEVHSDPFASLAGLQSQADEAYYDEDYLKAISLYEQLRAGAKESGLSSAIEADQAERLDQLEYEGEYGLFWSYWKKEDVAKAREHGGKSELLASGLLKKQGSPENHQRLLMVMSDLYSLEYEQKEWAKAENFAERALSLAREYLAVDAADPAALEQLAARLVDCGDVEYEQKAPSEAEKYYREAVSFLAGPGEKLNDNLQISLTEARLGLADILTQLGRSTESSRVLGEVKVQLKQLKDRKDFSTENESWLKTQQDWLNELTE